MEQGPLTLDKWVKFQRDYEYWRAKLDEVSEVEEQALIFKQLNAQYQREVLQEQQKRAQYSHWVKIQGMGRHSMDDMRRELMRWTNGKIVSIERNIQTYLVECQTEEAQDKVIKKFHRKEINGETIHAKKMERKLPIKEVFELIAQKLRVEEKLKLLQGSNTPKESEKSPPTHHSNEHTN